MVDKLTAMMMVVVTFVSLLVHVYTIGYMAEDDGYQRFFSYISLFTFSMLMLVMSNNFLQLFFGWEAVGLVSYLLIGFWYRKPSAIFANLKAFLVNRVGDFGFLLGIAGVLFWIGTLDYATVFANAPTIREPTVSLCGRASEWSVPTVICICLFIGAMGKSAQVPLHVWLPDSMEGPTPISALIHAATMVTAGIFMVARMSPLFEMSHDRAELHPVHRRHHRVLDRADRHGAERHQARGRVLDPVAAGLHDRRAGRVRLFGGGVPSDDPCVLQGAAVPRRRQRDHRHAPRAGHAQDGRAAQVHADHLRHHACVGTLALVGTPFFSGFYSKDTIIEAAAPPCRRASGNWIAQYANWAVLLGAFVTSFYSFRLLYLTFFGEERFRDAHAHDAHAHGAHAHDDHCTTTTMATMACTSRTNRPWVVTLPLVLLAIPSIRDRFPHRSGRCCSAPM